MMFALIMAGGSGTRFWPASRNDRPKQMLELVGDQTMLQGTVGRLDGLVPPENVLIMTNERLVEAVREQLPALPRRSVLGEPAKRDTAPCVAVAAAMLVQRSPEAVMVVMPADHVIGPTEVFQTAISAAVAFVEEHPKTFLTFGIRPTYPSTAFGYIERGDELARTDAGPVYRVARFREKPNAMVATEYVASGRFSWNAGIFVWKAAAVLAALEEHAPEIAETARAIAAAPDSQFEAVFAERFASVPAKSIDYAIMEKYDDVAIIEAPFQWDDIGNWTAMSRLHPHDDHHNTLVGDTLTLGTKNSIIRSENGHLIVTVGVEDLIVVHTGDATLVANRHDEEALRQVVKVLEERGMAEYL